MYLIKHPGVDVEANVAHLPFKDNYAKARHSDAWKKGTVDNGVDVFLKGIKHA